MSSSCRTFVAHAFKKGQCRECFRPESEHNFSAVGTPSVAAAAAAAPVPVQRKPVAAAPAPAAAPKVVDKPAPALAVAAAAASVPAPAVKVVPVVAAPSVAASAAPVAAPVAAKVVPVSSQVAASSSAAAPSLSVKALPSTLTASGVQIGPDKEVDLLNVPKQFLDGITARVGNLPEKEENEEEEDEDDDGAGGREKKKHDINIVPRPDAIEALNAQFDAAFRRGVRAPVCVLQGPAGSGGRELALQYARAHLTAKDGRHHLVWLLDGSSPASALRSFKQLCSEAFFSDTTPAVNETSYNESGESVMHTTHRPGNARPSARVFRVLTSCVVFCCVFHRVCSCAVTCWLVCAKSSCNVFTASRRCWCSSM
jgi:hypothetical protein